MDFKIIDYKSEEYDRMVKLRYEVLRKPLGLTFSEKDLEQDKNDLLLAAFFPHGGEITGCCILTRLNEITVQLRQMAIVEFYQGKGLGCEMLAFSEQTAVKHNYKYIYLHARQTAVDFYKKQRYSIEGDLFTEVGIPHFEMLKILTRI